MNARGRGHASADDLADGIHRLAIRLLRGMRKEDEKSGLTGPRLSALSVVVFAGPLTLGELAAAEQVKPPTMTRLVRALEADGLVRREKDPADARVVRLRATARGDALLHEGRARRVRRLAGPIRALAAAERQALDEAVAILTRVVARLS